MCKVVIRLLGGWVKRQAAKREALCLNHQIISVCATNINSDSCEPTARPLSIVPQGISGKRMISGTGEH